MNTFGHKCVSYFHNAKQLWCHKLVTKCNYWWSKVPYIVLLFIKYTVFYGLGSLIYIFGQFWKNLVLQTGFLSVAVPLLCCAFRQNMQSGSYFVHCVHYELNGGLRATKLPFGQVRKEWTVEAYSTARAREKKHRTKTETSAETGGRPQLQQHQCMCDTQDTTSC